MDNGADLQVLLDTVAPGLEEVALLGYSSGGPNALAAAHSWALQQSVVCRVRVVGIISSDGPYVEIGLAPITADEATRAAKAMARDIRKSYESLQKRPDRHRAALADYTEATRQGLVGCEQDLFLERTPWGFRLEDVRCPVLLWHGIDDHDV